MIRFILLLLARTLFATEYTITKHNVQHNFVSFDPKTDEFITTIFQDWENETFEAFDQVKDPRFIAIDLGAWIGTTSIWLSKNFHHVIAIECDAVSRECLALNLEASDCKNVTICPNPIGSKNEEVIFGPRESHLNLSTSYIKEEISNPFDNRVRSLTFKQMLYDYIYTNDDLCLRRISFIKCDIEGGEENILEDVLHFAYSNNCSVHMSFHLDWWRSHTIEDFAYLFEYFTTDKNCSGEELCRYLQEHPFAAILFKRKRDAGVLVKKNMPIVIIGYNQYTYIKNMVQQLEKYSSDILVIDNNSDYPPLLDYYANEYKYTLLKRATNLGHIVYGLPFVKKLTGDLFILTDPDLQLNPALPDDFIDQLVAISNYFEAESVGFALRIDSEDMRSDIFQSGRSIQEIESKFWQQKLEYPYNEELYEADIDTTFCLINRKFSNPAIRVAGPYTCTHLPWQKGFEKALLPGEYEYYLQENKSTTYWKIDSGCLNDPENFSQI